jgi:hypothetical protein
MTGTYDSLHTLMPFSIAQDTDYIDQEAYEVFFGCSQSIVLLLTVGRCCRSITGERRQVPRQGFGQLCSCRMRSRDISY